MKYPCYTTRTGIRIGCAYQPPLRGLNYEEELIQSVFIAKKKKVVSLKVMALICLGLAISIVWITKP